MLSGHRGLYFKTHVAGVAVVAFTPCASELLQLLRLYPNDGAMPRRILNEGILASTFRVIRANPGVAATMLTLEALLLAIYAAALRGLLRGLLRGPSRGYGEKVPLMLVALLALYFLLISGGAQAVGRYRLPVMPELCILAAGGLLSMRNRRRGATADSAAMLVS
jgi:hypothetical protein